MQARIMKSGMLIACAGLLVLFGCSWTSASNRVRGRGGQIFTEKEMMDMLLENYERTIRPNTTSGTGVQVKANLLIRSISRVDDTNMDYSVQLTFREEWNDDRLAYDDGGYHEYLVIPDPDRLWKPDIFFQNEKSAHFHNVMVPNRLARLYPNGDLMTSTRISLVLGCPMNLRLFPMDRQVCEIRFASYGSTSRHIELAWKQSQDAAFYPAQLAHDLSMPRFKLAGRKVGNCTAHTTTGSYSCLKVSLFLERSISHYIVKFYLPTMMLVLVSWISFWLDPEALTARILLCIMTLLAMSEFSVHISSQMPPVSYTTAVDVWSGVCMTFLFLALLENAAVNFLNKKNRDRQRRMAVADPNAPAAKPLLGQFVIVEHRSASTTLADKLDFFARIVFPAAFFLFNVFYWSISLGSVPNWPSEV